MLRDRHMFWSQILLILLILSSCRTYEPMAPGPTDAPAPSKTQSLHLEVVPWRVLMAPGMVGFVYVTVLDGEGNPLPDKEVRAVMDNPAVATLDKERKLTDTNGKAMFVLTGIAFPELTTLTLYADGMSYTIEVDAFSPSISLLWSPLTVSMGLGHGPLWYCTPPSDPPEADWTP